MITSSSSLSTSMNQQPTTLFLSLLLFISQLTSSSCSTQTQTRTQLVNTDANYETAPSAPQPSAVYHNDDGIGHLHHRHHQQAEGNSVACPACLDARLIQHYHIRGCTAVTLGHCHCPSRFKCPVDVPTSRAIGGMKNSRSIRGGGGGSGHHSSTDQNNARSLKIMTAFGGGGGGRFSSISCLYNSTHYSLGQIVPTSDVCRICVCGYHSDGTVGVDCETSIQCPAIRSVTPPVPNMWMQNQAGQLVSSFLGRTIGGQLSPVKLNCYDFFEHDKCCPRQECVPVNARTGRTLQNRATCRYNKQTYLLGEKIDLASMLKNDPLADENGELEREEEPELLSMAEESSASSGASLASAPPLRRNQFPPNFPEEVACLSCICTEQWNSSALEERGGLQKLSSAFFLQAMGGSCRRKRCEMELDPRFKAGCLPVYHEDQCCPVDFVCPRTRYMSMRVRGLDSGSKLCKFEGRKYPVGSMLYQMDHSAAPCVDCECRIPPEFTCLQRKDCIATSQQQQQQQQQQDNKLKRAFNWT